MRGRVAAVGAQGVDAARERDQLRHPVAGGHGRVAPLDREHALGRKRPGALGDGGDARLQPRADRLGIDAEGIAHPRDVVPHVAEAHRRERDDLHRRLQERGRRRLDLGEAHGADVALVLRHDVARPRGAQDLGIEVVEAERRREQLAHLLVDRAARLARVDARAGAGGRLRDLRRPVALVAAGDDALGTAQGRDDLGRARHQRGDAGGAHGTLTASASWAGRRRRRPPARRPGPRPG